MRGDRGRSREIARQNQRGPTCAGGGAGSVGGGGGGGDDDASLVANGGAEAPESASSTPRGAHGEPNPTSSSDAIPARNPIFSGGVTSSSGRQRSTERGVSRRLDALLNEMRCFKEHVGERLELLEAMQLSHKLSMDILLAGGTNRDPSPRPRHGSSSSMHNTHGASRSRAHPSGQAAREPRHSTRRASSARSASFERGLGVV